MGGELEGLLLRGRRDDGMGGCQIWEEGSLVKTRLLNHKTFFQGFQVVDVAVVASGMLGILLPLRRCDLTKNSGIAEGAFEPL